MLRTLNGYFNSEGVETLREAVFPPEQRRPKGWFGLCITLLAASAFLLTLYWAFTFTWTPIATRATHLAIMIPLTFFLYPAISRGRPNPYPTIYDIGWALVAFLGFAYTVYSEDRFNQRIPFYTPLETLDIVAAIACIAVIFEATRRTIGMAIVVINFAFIFYALAGPIFPGVLKHRGVSALDMVESIYVFTSGMFNFITGLMVTFVFIFLSFGVFLAVSRGDKVFTDFALSIAGHRRGGPAKVAVISSALMGSISGSSIANVVTTGSLTIPLMKRVGFRPHEAGAIETVASVGGILTPPIMGATIFILAEFTGVPISEVLLYSILPALLYFASLYFYVDTKAGKRDLAGLPRAELPQLKSVLLQGGHLFIPLIALIWMLLVGFSPFYAGALGLCLIVPISYLRRHTRMTPDRLLVALEGSSRVMISLTALGVSAAIIYSVIVATGLIVKLSTIILALSGGSLVLAMLLVALSSYVLGMGLPVAAAYVLLAATAAPALEELGVSLFAAHMIILWFSQDSTITPPVCMTAFVAARIAKAPPMKTGWHTVLMAKALYIIPFAFAFGDLLDGTIDQILFDSIALFAFFMLMPAIFEGWWFRRLSLIERGLLLVPALGFLIGVPGSWEQAWMWTAGSAVLMGAMIFYFRRTTPREEAFNSAV